MLLDLPSDGSFHCGPVPIWVAVWARSRTDPTSGLFCKAVGGNFVNQETGTGCDQKNEPALTGSTYQPVQEWLYQCCRKLRIT